MFILVPIFEINGINSYPDDLSLFGTFEPCTIDNEEYFLVDYSGELSLETGPHNYEQHYLYKPKADVVIVTVAIISAKIDAVEQSDDYRLKLPVGSTTTLTFELRDSAGNVLPIGTTALEDDSGHFAVPIARLGGEVIDSIELKFVDGSATLTETWNNSGEYIITEDLLNTYVDNTLTKFLFKGLAFSVYRAGV